jgi:alkanesulfonate monooxygenase SsuD/methylene tetrahydromethanopterin reductase-like flavin-dependent oxidoreductase (luciferase family)
MGVRFGLHFSCSSTEGDWAGVYRAAIEQSRVAESLGYDCAVVAEHHFTKDGWIPAPTILCGALAASTTRLRIGTDIIVLPLHNPLNVAEQMLVLDNLTNGRAVCGFGMGGRKEDFEVYGIPFQQRVSRSEEALTIIRKLYAEENVTHQGKYFQLGGVTATPRPIQKGGPPIWYGAISEAGARRAAKFADQIVMGPAPNVDELTAMKKAWEDEMVAQGKDPRKAPIILRREGYIAATDGEAWRIGSSPLKYQYTKVYTWRLDDSMSDEAFREYSKDRFIFGGPERFREEIAKFKEAIDPDVIIFRFQMPTLPQSDVMQAVKTLGEKVVPYV